MARNKAIFDADILINVVKTKSIEYLISVLKQIYVSDYVWNCEIKQDTHEYFVIKRMRNSGFIKILKFSELTVAQQGIYKNAYKILKIQTMSEFVNEGERITAAYAKAHNVAYYMSDDNKAAPHIRSVADIEVINYCDLLYIAYTKNEDDYEELEKFYSNYLRTFTNGQVPKNVKSRNGMVLSFDEILVKNCDKFEKSKQLRALEELFKLRN
ncbi:MAG: hypothetical protein PHI90_05750 [Clostridia bacterium]|nr:hypothetical protein [Clostridia bacterium]MDD4048316.1 hypothetical protein [Clostridia bacterium]